MKKLHADNLSGKMLRKLLEGIAAGLFLFLLLYFGGKQWLDQYFFESGYFLEAEAERVRELQKYLDENGIAVTDSVKLRKWAKDRNINSFTVSRGKNLLFDVTREEDILPGGVQVPKYRWKLYYSVAFADGKADVYLYEGFAEKYYDIILAVAIIAGIFVCLGIFVNGIREEVEYIKFLKQKVELIAQGNLEEKITVRGRDELADLASGLNYMRLKIIDKEQTEQELRSAQEKLVLGMSHDLRTPLTGLMTYIEILKKQENEGKVTNEYIDKAFDKIMQIRTLSDQMFEYFLINSQQTPQLEPLEEIQSVFGDYLSELCALLESCGYRIDADELEWKSVSVRVNTDYLGRIINNIISNIEKYGDKLRSVRIKIIYDQDSAGVSIENGIALPNHYVQGTGIGTKNIALMMENMGGKMEINMSEETYCIILWFPISL